MGYVYRHIRLDKNKPFCIGSLLVNNDKYYRSSEKWGRNKI